MLGVKLTILGLILLFIIIFIARIIIRASNIETVMKIANNDFPEWYEALAIIAGILILLDMIGIIYSTIWILFYL